MAKLAIDRASGRARPVAAVFALAGASLFELGAKGSGGMNVWPIVGIAAVLLAAFIASKFVRGDPYYDRNASNDRRESGPAPWGGDGGGDGGGWT